MPLDSQARFSRRAALLDKLAHRVAGGQLHTPGVGHVSQQELGELSVRVLVPMHAVSLPVLLRMAKVEMQVQHVETVLLRLSRAVEVGFDHAESQAEGQGLLLPQEEGPGDFLANRHGRVPHQEA